MQNPRFFPRCVVVFFSVLFLLGLPSLVTALESNSSLTERRLVGLVDYINGDYGKAVQDGKVVSPAEYQELLNFVGTAQKLWKDLGYPSKQAALVQLEGLIKTQAPRAEIESLCYDIRSQLLTQFQLKVPPKATPDWTLAAKVYQDKCASCHGANGHGDGPAGQGLDPVPRNFHDPEVMSHSSPSKFYNTLITGIQGTAMRSFATELSEEERWSLAFYLFSFRFHESLQKATTADPEGLKVTAKKIASLGLTANDLAYMTDHEFQQWLKEKLSQEGRDPQNIENNGLMVARSTLPTDPQFPLVRAGTTAASQDMVSTALEKTLELVKSARDLIKENRAREAEGNLLDAYLDHFEGVERSLVLIDPTLVQGVEQHFIAARGAIQSGNRDLSLGEVDQLETLINKARSLTSGKAPQEKNQTWTDFISSFLIIVREGIEAFLVVAALLAVMNSLGFARGKRWIHLGWIAAVLTGFVTYVVFEWILHFSGESRELMEALLTGSAVLVLFYTGFWLLSQAERSKWDKYIKARTLEAMDSGKLWSLFGVAFIAVYREAAETVLFYSALLNTAQSTWHVGAGFLAGCILLLGICWGILRLNLRLPLKQFFKITSLLMITLSVTLAGKSVHELIEGGLIKPTVLAAVPSIDFLGIYPSAETLLTQILLIFAGIFGVLWMRSQDVKEQ